MVDGASEKADSDEFGRPEVDAVGQFERVIDVQSDIDNKAGHTARLIAILLGVILTGISLWNRHVSSSVEPSNIVEMTFGLGVLSLVLSMTLAILTYLSSRFRPGFHPAVADSITESLEHLTVSRYHRVMLNTYASAIETNQEILQINAKLFNSSLMALLSGIGFLTLAVYQFAAIDTLDGQIVVFALGTAIIVMTAGLIITYGSPAQIPFDSFPGKIVEMFTPTRSIEENE